MKTITADQADKFSGIVFRIVDAMTSKPVVWFIMGLAVGIFGPVALRG